MAYSFALLSLLAGSALAHLQLSDPLPIRSPLDSAVPNDSKDYSYTAPLVSNGLPYPCKGYLDSADSLMPNKKTWAAGSTQSYTIAEGGAIHGGGSCQVSLSYDMGKTWNVIQSSIGGCMLEGLQESFTIPKEAPSGKAVFSWSWFNNLGNREMYQNCAMVTITNGGSGLNSRDHPAPFVANAGAVNSCSTAPSRDVVFPNPGKAVKYSGGYAGTVPQAGLNVVGSDCSHPGGADGAGTRPGAGGAVADSKELLASASAAAPASSAVPPSSSSAVSPATTSSTAAVQAPASSAAAAATSSATSPSTAAAPGSSTTAAAPGSTTTAARTCRRRRSNTKKSVVPVQAELQAHRQRRVRRQHGSFVPRRMDPESRAEGRVAALPAGRPVYADKA